MRHWFGGILIAALMLFPAPARSQQMSDATPFTQLDRNDPLAVSNISLGAASNALRVCFAFRNLASKDVTSAEFHFIVADQFGTDRLAANFIRNANGVFSSGSTVSPPQVNGPGFSDTNDGSQSCWLISSNSLRRDLAGINNGGKLILTVTGVAFSDGTKWTRGAAFPRAFNADGSRFVFVPVPFVTSWTTTPDAAPVVVVGAGVASTAFGTPKMQQCVSFRTTTNEAATSIFFRYIFSDANGVPIPGENWHWTATGTFTPPILIADKCWTAPLPPADMIRRMRREVISVEDVTFADGSEWKRGTQYLKAFSGDGTAFTGPQPVVAAITGPGGAAFSAAPSQTSSSLGGIIGPSGQQFGEIAWILPTTVGQTTVVTGTAVDKPSLFEAQHAAMEACETNASAQGQDKSRCTLLVKERGLNTAVTRCAVLGMSGIHYDVGLGRSLDDADLDLINKIRAAGGSVEEIHYVAKVCNSV